MAPQSSDRRRQLNCIVLFNHVGADGPVGRVEVIQEHRRGVVDK